MKSYLFKINFNLMKNYKMLFKYYIELNLIQFLLPT